MSTMIQITWLLFLVLITSISMSCKTEHCTDIVNEINPEHIESQSAHTVCITTTTTSYKEGSEETEVPVQDNYYFPVSTDDVCGLASKQKLWEGEVLKPGEVEYGSAPWQAYIKLNSKPIICGAVLINAGHVLTAGHCVAKYVDFPQKLSVMLGDHILDDGVWKSSEPYWPISVAVVEIKLHPDYYASPEEVRNDIAILQLSMKVNYRPNVRPICLPHKMLNMTGHTVLSSGWTEFTTEPERTAMWRKLRAIELTAISSTACQEWYSSNAYDTRISSDKICTGIRRGQQGFCQGDRGGSLTLQNDGKWYLIGILVHGFSCHQPSVYSRASAISI